MVVHKVPTGNSRDRSVVSLPAMSGAGRMRDQLDRSARRWFVASVIIGAVLAIFFHALVGSFVVSINELSYGVLGRTLGAEVVASAWALLAFAGSALVFARYHSMIPGTGLWKGIRYGSAVGIIWLVGMLEGVALFGNPLLNEFLIGLSDAIPVMVMSILLGVFVFRSTSSTENVAGKPGQLQATGALLLIALVYVAVRYLGYVGGIIGSGHVERPVLTFVWTALMGLSVGVAFLLLLNAVLSESTTRSAARFGLGIFGVNWFVFMVFIPMLFEGVFVDVMTRVSLDIGAVVLGCYLALRFWYREG